LCLTFVHNVANILLRKRLIPLVPTLSVHSVTTPMHTFQQPLFIITGPSGAGKTTVCLELVSLMNECVVMESDILWAMIPRTITICGCGSRKILVRQVAPWSSVELLFLNILKHAPNVGTSRLYTISRWYVRYIE